MPGDETWDRDADLESVRTTYDEYDAQNRARLWDEGRPGYARLVREMNDELLAALRSALPHGSARVLDLGCGTGDLLDVVAPIWPDLDWVGVDLRDDAIDEARRRHPGAAFIAASADAVPLPDGEADVIVCRLMFATLPSWELESSVAVEIGRLLRPSGSVVWLDLRYDNPFNPAVHGLPEKRLRRLFPGWHLELASCGLLPPLARRLGPLTPFAYPVLRAIGPLRSHLVGRLQPPSTR